MRMVMILAMMLLASTAYASSGSTSIDIVGSNTGDAIISAGPGSLNMDIVGSNVGDAHINSGGAIAADIEVVGSTTGEINISREVPVPSCCCNIWCNKPLCYPYSSYIPKSNCYPYNQDMHMGVDAWHGCYWYTPVYLPKWPMM